ncbi:enolase C-terminal domain-like protein [Streptomyces sp. NPDC005374]|uniref:enolase C-terminal domain-like protein n=1 Tax=Streptomyces sp. NPDC005374 TaxID=3364713 RepID=UPI0036AC61A4
MDACGVVDIEPSRVDGCMEARRVHDVARAHAVPVWCGGMPETGIGRTPNLALAAQSGFTLPGDTSASSRCFAEDITEPFAQDDRHLRDPSRQGIEVEPFPRRYGDPRFAARICTGLTGSWPEVTAALD